MEELQRLRLEIDGLDQKLVEALEKRFLISQKMTHLKKGLGIAIQDLDRERSIYKNVLSLLHEDHLDEHVLAVFQVILDESKKIQNKERTSCGLV